MKVVEFENRYNWNYSPEGSNLITKTRQLTGYETQPVKLFGYTHQRIYIPISYFLQLQEWLSKRHSVEMDLNDATLLLTRKEGEYVGVCVQTNERVVVKPEPVKEYNPEEYEMLENSDILDKDYWS